MKLETYRPKILGGNVKREIDASSARVHDPHASPLSIRRELPILRTQALFHSSTSHVISFDIGAWYERLQIPLDDISRCSDRA